MLPVSGSVLLLMFLYFIQGLPYGLQAQFLPVYLRSKGVNLTDIGLLKFLYVPWLCKFLWGPLVDQLGMKRKWLLISVLCLGITCIFGAFFPPEHLIPVVIILFLLNLFASIQDVAVDAIAIRLLTVEELGQGNAVQVVGYKLGSIFGGGILASFVHVIGWMGLFLVLAVLYVEAGMFIFVSPSLRNLDICSQPNSKVKTDEQISPCKKKASSGEVDDEILETQTVDCTAGSGDRKCLSDFSNSILFREEAGLAQEPCCNSTFVESRSDSGQMCTHHNDQVSDVKRHLSEELEKMHKKSGLHNTFLRVLDVPGTKWMLAFLLIFKLGEQGALNMLPLFFLDKKIEPSEVTFWTGIVGQGVSICGSVLGGCFVTVFRKIPLDFMLQQLCLLRLLPAGAQLLLVVIWDVAILYKDVFFCVAIATLLLLLLLSGIITTVTFTFMMQCSRSANPEIQATHYTSMATVEVLGKLAFTAACGWLADIFGYRFLFLSFAALSMAVLPLLKACPEELTCAESCSDSTMELEPNDDSAKDKTE